MVLVAAFLWVWIYSYGLDLPTKTLHLQSGLLLLLPATTGQLAAEDLPPWRALSLLHRALDEFFIIKMCETEKITSTAWMLPTTTPRDSAAANVASQELGMLHAVVLEAETELLALGNLLKNVAM
jgi:hypothetical protein